MNIRRRAVAPPEPETVRARIRAVRGELTPSEAKVVTVLLDDYPVAGIRPVVALAGSAGVSAPTVLRLLVKLGFPGYRQFREALTSELAGGRGFSPLSSYRQLGRVDEPVLARSRRMLVEGVDASIDGLDASSVDTVVDWLVDPAADIWVTGGKFSSVLATYLAGYLRLLRTGVSDVATGVGERERALLDIGPRSVCVVFDYRRYQSDTVRFGRRAAGSGARLVLLTDPYLSPLADRADAVLTSVVHGPSPYDVLTPAFAVTEVLLAVATERIGATAAGRLERFERWQEEDNGAGPATG